MNQDIIVLNSLKSISAYMAETFVSLAATAIDDHGTFAVALSGGGTPQGMFDLLATAAYAQRVDWSKVHVFWGDERCVAPDQDGSNFKQANDALLTKVSLPAENIHRVKTELDCETAAHDYMRQLEAFALAYQPSSGPNWPTFDMLLLGLGSDGHTASIFPNSPICIGQATRVAVADYDGRPANRVTLTESVLNDARHLYVLVAGERKANIVREVLEVATDDAIYPMLRIRPKHGTLTYVLDQAAAAKLTAPRTFQ